MPFRELQIDNAIIILVVASIIVYIIYGVIYRLYLNPISRFPGPRIAAVSYLYEFYYDVIKRGQYTWKIADLHEKYGPIVRINPDELHINDPDFYDEIYVSSAKRRTNTWWLSNRMFDLPDTSFCTVDHDLHRRRRNAYSSYFSKQSVQRLEPIIMSSVDKLCSRLEGYQSSGNVVNMWHAFSALTVDIISGHCFPESNNQLDLPEFSKEFCAAMLGFSETMSWSMHLWWLSPVMHALPNWMVKRLNPDIGIFLVYQKKWTDQILRLKVERDSTSNKEKPLKRSIFDSLLESDLPASEKSTRRLMLEAQLMYAAGTLPTAAMLNMSTFHVLSNPSILAKLMDELNKAIIDPFHLPSASQLERLPYLTAVTNEGLRMSYGISHRLQRIAPDNAISFHGDIIPPGTPVGMTTVLMHDNASIFPDPYTFKPERWLPLETEGQRLQKYFVPFSRGSRACLGMNLAHAEMLIALAGVFRRFGNDMKVWETIRERDIDVKRDFFNPIPAAGANHLRIKIDRRVN